MADGWSAYGGIENLQREYIRKEMNHERFFVHPKDRSVYIQSMSFWGSVKKNLKVRYGEREYLLKGQLFNYMFCRYRNNKKLLNHLLLEMFCAASVSSSENDPIEDDDDSEQQKK